jgi:hypothetical protein
MHPTKFHPGPPLQGPVGRSPQRYLEELPESHQPQAAVLAKIPGGGKQKLTREEARAICRNSEVPPLIACACIMAWGGRDFRNYRLNLLDGGEAIACLVETLRASMTTRAEDFEATQKAAQTISGLGISFYTKLLFFLRPKPDAYILDQWTAKSSVVHFQGVGIRLNAAGLPDPKTCGKDYESFCARLEACCGSKCWGEAWKTGEEVERTLFDSPKGAWRTYVKDQSGEETVARRRSKQLRGAKVGDGDEKSRKIRHLSEQLKESYEKALDTGLSLPEGCGGFSKPNRLHVRAHRGFQFQFILNQQEVRAQLFLIRTAESHYSGLVKKMQPKVQGPLHDFGHGITGNGPMQGRTRAIDLAADLGGGWGSPETEWPAIAESAIEAMAALFHFLEPHLSAD